MSSIQGPKCAACGREPAKNLYYAFRIKKYKKYDRRAVRYVDAEHIFVNGRKVNSDFKALFGDLHCYWAQNSGKEDVYLCCRDCAIMYSAQRRRVLIKDETIALVTPHQEQFDAYAVKHQLEHHIASMEEDGDSSEVVELRRLLRMRLQFPGRLIELAHIAAEQGHKSLVQRSAEKLLDEYPFGQHLDHACLLLSRLGDIERTDSLYESARRRVGSYETLGAGRLSTWALLIAIHNPEKAVQLSATALSLTPSDPKIISNHVTVLGAGNRKEERLEFLRGHAPFLNTHVGYFNAGRVFLDALELQLAREYFDVALLYHRDPMTRRFLAEALLQLGQYEEARAQVSAGLRDLDQYEGGAYADANGESCSHWGYTHKEKKNLRADFFALDGKLLYALGEEETGKERLRDALDLRGPVDIPLFADIPDYLGGYVSREELTAELKAQQETVARLSNSIREKDFQIGSFSSLVDAIADVQDAWHASLAKIKEEILYEAVNEDFSSRIHSFSLLLRSLEAGRYEQFFRETRDQYPHLPDKVVEQLSNALFLIDVLEARSSSAPVFAGAVIEYAKALETGVNQILIESFARHLISKRLAWRIDVATPSGRPFTIQLVRRNRPQSLMLAELGHLVQAEHSEWRAYLMRQHEADQEWISGPLADVLFTVKDKYRNGCAHHHSATGTHVLAMQTYLAQMGVFERLESMSAGH